jgi:hypothetical protein
MSAIFPKVTNNLPEKGTRQSKRGIAATQLQQRFSRSGICAGDQQDNRRKNPGC